jgi:PAS domain S-box-containing protein
VARQVATDTPDRAWEVARSVEENRPRIVEAWRRLLRRHWGDVAAAKLQRIEDDTRGGHDLFSLALAILVASADPSERDLSALVAKVRRLDYSIADLFSELSCLADALEEVLRDSDRLHRTDLERFLGRVRQQVRLLFAAVLKQTAAVYEAVTENTGCGYCQLDDDGVIVFANAEMGRLLGGATEGVVLPKLFGDEGAFVLSAIRGDYGPNPGLRRLKLRGPDDSTIVNVSPAPLVIDGAKSGGYAIVSDVSKISESDRRIFDRHPLGIVRYDLTQQITYANLKAGEILGRDAAQLPGTPLLALVPDARNRQIVQRHFKKRMEGVSDEYELRVTRLDDGRSVPVMVAGSTEFDNQDRPVGGFVIFRSVELEHAVEAIHYKIETSRSTEAASRGGQDRRQARPLRRALGLGVQSGHAARGRALSPRRR